MPRALMTSLDASFHPMSSLSEQETSGGPTSSHHLHTRNVAYAFVPSSDHPLGGGIGSAEIVDNFLAVLGNEAVMQKSWSTYAKGTRVNEHERPSC